MNSLSFRLACSSSYLVFSSLVGAAVLAASPVEAQAQSAAAAGPTQAAPVTSQAQAGDAASGAGAIVVTARLRKENIEKVPVAVTYLSTKQLQTQQILKYTDLQRQVPGLTVPTSYASGVQSIYIRGYAATTYFSEVPAPLNGTNTILGAINPLYDISSIQVLKGPQGTLFGATSLGGAVLITPTHPNLHEYQGGIDLLEGNLGLSNFNAYLNIPLVDDQLAVRVAVERQHTDGYTQVIGSNTKLDEVNNEGGRFSIDWRPDNGRFENYTLATVYNENETPASRMVGGLNPGNAYFNLPSSTATPAGAAAGTQYYGAICAGAVANKLSPDITTCENQHLGVLAATVANLKQEAARVAAGGKNDREEEMSINPALPIVQQANNISLTDITTFDVGKFGPLDISVKNIFNYFLFKDITSTWVAQDTYDYSTYGGTTGYIKSVYGQPGLITEGGYNQRYSDEFQIHGDVDKTLLVWVLGAYALGAPSPENLLGGSNFNLTYAGANTQNFGFVYAGTYNLGGWATQYGEYAQATLDMGWLVKGLHFTAGVRDNQSLTVTDTAPATYNYAAGTAGPGVESRLKSVSDGLGWTFALDYQVTDDLLLYATNRRAFIPGGVNPFTAVNVGLPDYTSTYQPTLLTDYEIGTKYEFELGQMRGRLNLDAYHDTFNDIVVPIIGYTVAGGLVSYNENAANAVKQGVEVDLDLFPVHNLEIQASYAYQDAHYVKYYASDPLSIAKIGNPLCNLAHSTATTCILNLDSNPLYTSPANQLNLSLLYTLPLKESDGTLVADLTVSGQSQSWFSSNGARDVQAFGSQIASAVSQAPYATVNARLDWSHILGSNVEGALFVNNLTDALYKDGGFDSLATLGVASVNFAPPRTFGVELTYRFGG